MSEELITPTAMMDLLHSLYPESVRASLYCASLEMLRDLYNENMDDPQVKAIQCSLDRAVDKWNDEQVEDFLVNCLLEPSQSDDFRRISPQERRSRLRQIYIYLFDPV